MAASTTDREKVILFVREKEMEEIHIFKNDYRKEILESTEYFCPHG